MVFNWLDFLDIADKLHEIGTMNTQNSVAAYRSAVGRAYYGIFCHARDYAEDYLQYKGEARGNDHYGVPKHYKKHNPQVSRELQQLHEFRKNCDYDLIVTQEIDADKTRQIIKRARKLKDIIDTIPKIS